MLLVAVLVDVAFGIFAFSFFYIFRFYFY